MGIDNKSFASYSEAIEHKAVEMMNQPDDNVKTGFTQRPKGAAATLTVAAQRINDLLPIDVSVDSDANGRWHWYFRCITSEDDAEDGFNTPVDALCDFVKYMIEGADQLMGLNYGSKPLNPEMTVAEED